MTLASRLPLAATPLDRADALMLWLFFGCGALVSAGFALLYGLGGAVEFTLHRDWLVAACLGCSASFAAGFVLAARGRLALAVQGACWATWLAVGVVSVALGEGVHALPLGFLAILVCLACVLAGLNAGLALMVGSTLLVLGLALAERHQWLPLQGAQTLTTALIVQSLLLFTGLVAGITASHALDRSLRAAREREQRFRGLLGIAADWYWEQDEQLRYTHLSEARPGRLGLDLAHYIGRRRWEVEALELAPEAWAAHRAELDARRPFRDFVVHRKGSEGQPFYVSLSGEPVFDAAGRFTGYWGVGRDVTEPTLAERLRRATEGRYRELFARSPSSLLLHRRGLIVDANDAAVALLGYATPAAMVGVDIGSHHEPGAPLAAARARAASLDALPLGTALPPAAYTLRRNDGGPVEVLVSSLRVELDDGPAILSIYTDLTAQRAAEQALRRSEMLLEQLVAATPDTLSITEFETGRYLMINQAFTRLLGWTQDEVIGRTAAELGIWRRPADRERLLAAIREHGRVVEMPASFGAKSGAAVPLRASAARFTLEGRDYLVVSARDVSAVEQSRLEHEAILQHASIGIAFTRDRRFLHANPRFEQMCGRPPGSLAGQSGAVVWPSEDEYAEIGRIAGPLLAAGKPFEVERELVRLDGSRFWCRMLAQVVDPGDPSRGGTIWIAEDVTERRATEQALAAARDAAEAANRAKSAFLANTSHEIRTPLNGLLGLARLVQPATLDAARRGQYLKQILESAESLSAIISDILDLSKIEAGKLDLETRPFAPREALGAICQAYASLAEERGLVLTLAVADAVPAIVSGDALRVRQILGNFLGNALKFTERGRIEVGVAPADGGRLRLTVADTGAGIDAATQARLFQPFTQADDSTTRRYGGTGLGLSICRQLARLMGGEVGVDSTLGQGSRFWAELPLPAAEAAAAVPQEDAATAERLRGARVLLVEDNPVNLMIAVAMLEQWGVEVSQAHDGQQALDAVARAERDGAAPFDAVLMDVQMPVMSGHEAARRLRERHGADRLPIIALTAAVLVSEREQALAAGMNAFLIKPIDAEQLRRTLAQVLEGRLSIGA